MSSSIWTRCADKARVKRFDRSVWRVVEAQHLVSTRKLVDSDSEQRLLEELLESSKAPLPDEPEFRGLHYLLATPFRYPPLRHGSRFGSPRERSILYASFEVETAMCELAYYRLVLLEGTDADLGTLMLDVSAFSISVATRRFIDLRSAPFDAHRSAIASPSSYRATQALGRDMRAEGIEAFAYPCARGARGARGESGTNVGLFTPRALKKKRPGTPKAWHCTATRDVVEITERDFFKRRTLRFERKQFLVRGRLPAPAV